MATIMSGLLRIVRGLVLVGLMGAVSLGGTFIVLVIFGQLEGVSATFRIYTTLAALVAFVIGGFMDERGCGE